MEKVVIGHKFDIGDVVFYNEDIKRKYPYIIETVFVSYMKNRERNTYGISYWLSGGNLMKAVAETEITGGR